MQRVMVYTLTALLILIGVGMVLSLTAGGVAFGVGFLSVALALWLLYRVVLALELGTDLLAQSLVQQSRTRDPLEPASHRPETVRKGARPAQPAPAED